jgi:hypothetical protein
MLFPICCLDCLRHNYFDPTLRSFFMDQDLLNLFGRGVVDQVETLFQDLELRGRMMFVAPLLGGLHPIENAPYVKRMPGKALIHRAAFAALGPPGSPPLPLHDADIGKLLHGEDARWRVEGFYARSLKQSEYDSRHPFYEEFRHRLAWSENAPPDLVGEQGYVDGDTTPELPGFDDESLCWLTPENYRLTSQVRQIMGWRT